MTKHIVTGIRPYDFVQEKTGERLQGVKVFYLSDHAEDEPNAKGYFPLNLTLTGDHVSKFTEVPAIYDLDFKWKPDKYGKPQVSLNDVKFVSAVKLPLV